MFQTLKYLPSNLFGIHGLEGEQVGIMFFGLGALLIFLVPILDRRASPEKRNKVFPIVGVLVILYLIVFTIIGRVSK